MARNRSRKARDDDRESLKMMTPEFRGSFVRLVKPRARSEGKEPEYGLTIVLEKDHSFWRELDDAIERAAEIKWGKVPKGFFHPVKDGDDYDYGFDGCLFVEAKSTERPGVVDTELEDVIDASELYSGAWYRATIRPGAWHHPESNRKGVSIYLDNVQKVRDDEPLGGARAKAADDFEDFVGGGDEGERPRRGRRGSRDENDEGERPRRGRRGSRGRGSPLD